MDCHDVVFHPFSFQLFVCKYTIYYSLPNNFTSFLRNNRKIKKMSTLKNTTFPQRGETISNLSTLLPPKVLFDFGIVCILHSLKILFMHILYFIQQEPLKCRLIRQLQHIGGDKQVVVHARNGIFHHLLSLTSA